MVSGIAGATLAHGYSFAGSDWTFSAQGQSVVVILPAFGGGTQTEPINENNVPIIVSQTTANQFSFPFTIGAFQGTGDFTVAGTTVTDVNNAGVTAPFVVNGYTVRVSYPTWTMTGTITGINNQVVGPFGPRAYHITGNPFTIANAQLQAQAGPFWVPAGTVNTTVTSWSMDRPLGNPTVTGILNFGQGTYYVGALPTSILVSVRNSANVQVGLTVATLNPVTGAFSVNMPAGTPDPYRISMKLNPWLRRTLPVETSPAFPFTDQAVGTVVFETGDIDADNEVTNADYSLWAAGNGNSGDWTIGDLDGDSEVTNADYALWAGTNGMQGDN